MERLPCFQDKTIDLKGIKLLQEDVECVAEFSSSSSIKAWVEVNLSSCGICGHIHTIYCKLKLNNITIEVLQLNYNNLTVMHASFVSQIVVNCRVQKLFINGNHGIGDSEQLYVMLRSPSTNLKELHMRGVKLSTHAIYLFRAIQHNNTLKELVVENNSITDDACEAITTTLQTNNCLTKLWMWNNPLSSEACKLILNALKNNKSLARLGLPCYNESTKRIIESLQEVVNTTREHRRCQVKLSVDFL